MTFAWTRGASPFALDSVSALTATQDDQRRALARGTSTQIWWCGRGRSPGLNVITLTRPMEFPFIRCGYRRFTDLVCVCWCCTHFAERFNQVHTYHASRPKNTLCIRRRSSEFNKNGSRYDEREQYTARWNEHAGSVYPDSTARRGAQVRDGAPIRA
jgi:hypothetical protein